MKAEEKINLACSQALIVKSRGGHCSQAGLCGMASLLELDEGYAMKLMSAFGGGMRHQQLCGAVVAAGTALGLALGADNYDKANNDRLGELTVEFVDRFTKELGTTVCGQLLMDKREAFHWDMPEELAFESSGDNENGNEFNLKVPVCGVAITSAVRIALEIIHREKGL